MMRRAGIDGLGADVVWEGLGGGEGVVESQLGACDCRLGEGAGGVGRIPQLQAAFDASVCEAGVAGGCGKGSKTACVAQPVPARGRGRLQYVCDEAADGGVECGLGRGIPDFF